MKTAENIGANGDTVHGELVGYGTQNDLFCLKVLKVTCCKIFKILADGNDLQKKKSNLI